MPKRCLSILPLLLLPLLALPLLVLAGCTHSPQQLPPAPTLAASEPPAFVALPAEQAIPQMIAAEREASRQGDEAALLQLWAEDAAIVDSRGTDDPADDFTWRSRAAIFDRYRLAVFPAPPPALEGPPTPAITVQGDSAHAANGQDRWVFIWKDGRWWMTELKY